MQAEYLELIKTRAATPLGAHGDCVLVTHVDFEEEGITNLLLQSGLVPCVVWAGLISGAYSAQRFELPGGGKEGWGREFPYRPEGEPEAVHAWLSACFASTRLQEYDDTGFHFLPATRPIYHMFLHA